jgi:ATP-binding cassette, subfamily B, bacterial
MSVSLPQYRTVLTTYLGPQRGRVALLAALLLASIALQLVNPQVIRVFIDATQTGAPQATLLSAAALFLGLAVAQRLAALAALYIGEQIGWRATNALRADLTRHLLRLDMGFHKRRTPGELIERVDGDVGGLGNFFSRFSLELAANTLLVLGVLALLFREDWRVGLGLSAYAALVFGVLIGLQRLASDRWARASQAHAEQFGFLEEQIGGVEDIRSSGAERYVLGRLAALGRGRMRAELRALMASNLTFVITNFLSVVGYALGLALGAWLYTRGEATIGTAFLIVFYIGMLSDPLERIRSQVEDLQQASAGLGRVAELLAIQPRVREREQPAALPPGPLGVAFERVSFAYDDDRRPSTDQEPVAIGQTVIDAVSFALAPGKRLGLLGRTGSGKSTLTRLIFRLYDPDAGAVRVGGQDLRDVSLDDLRARVGMVTQEVQIFQASLRDNLALFSRRIDDRRILRALEELGLREWAEALPEGLDTRLGAGGRGLSAGEAQLLAFTRVFLRDPGLVILDEASSRLDPATERLLERAVDRLLTGRTGIIIAHRLRTVQRADEILILDRGRVVEHGPRAALAADAGSRFAGLLRTGLEEALA